MGEIIMDYGLKQRESQPYICQLVTLRNIREREREKLPSTAAYVMGQKPSKQYISHLENKISKKNLENLAFLCALYSSKEKKNAFNAPFISK